MMKHTLDTAEKEIAGSLPLPRIGKPEDVFAACLWLSGKGGEWITGYVEVIASLFCTDHEYRATISVDGGGSVANRSKL